MQKPRGAYAKGIAKREAILGKALEAFSKSGYLATSMREIAAASGLTQAGLLHHFPNKEALLLAIIEQREGRQQAFSRSLAHLSLAERTLRMIEVNEQNRAETMVFSVLAAEAADPSHPAHDYMLNRYRLVREEWARSFSASRGAIVVSSKDLNRAALLTAIWDGLQLQALLDDSFEMREPFMYALEQLGDYKP
ncbi:MAG: TetR/AcrR family transcriptional regulator [Rhodoluna sp.]